MTNYQFHQTIVADDGTEVRFPVLVHELYSKPHSLLGVPEWASDEEIGRAVAQIEDKLGYTLEQPDDLDEIRMSEEEAEKYWPKTAGFHPVTGEFIAGGL